MARDASWSRGLGIFTLIVLSEYAAERLLSAGVVAAIARISVLLGWERLRVCLA